MHIWFCVCDVHYTFIALDDEKLQFMDRPRGRKTSYVSDLAFFLSSSSSSSSSSVSSERRSTDLYVQFIVTKYI